MLLNIAGIRFYAMWKLDMYGQKYPIAIVEKMPRKIEKFFRSIFSLSLNVSSLLL